jgi:hypothetical protein
MSEPVHPRFSQLNNVQRRFSNIPLGTNRHLPREGDSSSTTGAWVNEPRPAAIPQADGCP